MDDFNAELPNNFEIFFVGITASKALLKNLHASKTQVIPHIQT